MRYILSAVLVLLAILCFYKPSTKTHIPKVHILTMPKGGTNLLLKALNTLTQEEYSLGKSQIVQKKRILFDHLWPKYHHRLNEKKSLKILFFRDPRDMLISQMFWIDRVHNWAEGLIPQQEIDAFEQLSLDEKIHYLIDLPDPQCGVSYFTHLIAQHVHSPHVIALRFEDMVGPLGGGSISKQEDSIRLLAQSLDYKLSPASVSELCSQLYGGTSTFRNGKIGSWKAYFTEEHKRAFKEKMGKELILLGYENDESW